jgi:mono/diheme cytochrome c family protein
VANPVFLASASDEFLWRTIARGKDDTAMRGFLEGGSGGAMMALSSSDIDHAIAYLRSMADKPRVDLLNRTFPGASAKVGRELFVGKGGCSKCHGEDAEGASGLSLASPGFLRAASDGYLAATIVLGRDGTQMLSYWRGGNVHLAPRDVMDLVAYLRDLEGKPRAKTRPVDRSPGSVAEGKVLYGRFCSSCHGTEGQGSAAGPGTKGYAPSLNSPEFLAAADDGFLQATIAIGRPNTPMRPFGIGTGGVADLSAEQIRKITAYIRSWERKP